MPMMKCGCASQGTCSKKDGVVLLRLSRVGLILCAQTEGVN
jgi:hypothetical protein